RSPQPGYNANVLDRGTSGGVGVPLGIPAIERELGALLLIGRDRRRAWSRFTVMRAASPLAV
ncbi:hypothetical protein ACFQ34_09200, partial [Pseudonocardia benzenivorans]